MKVLFVIDSLAGGGAEKLLSDLLPLLKKDMECELLILSGENNKYGEELEKKNIKIQVIPSKIKGHLGKIRYISSFIINGNYDIVHANLFPVTYYCSIAKKITRKRFPKLVMTEHSTDNRRRHISVMRPLEKWIYKSYDKVISISESTQTLLKKWIQAKTNDKKYVVIYNGIHLDDYCIAKPYDKSSFFSSYKETDIFLGIVGSIKPLKNHYKMIDILAILPERYKLIIIGEGSLRKEIENYVQEKELNNRVRFLGFRTDIPNLMSSLDIIVVPSKWEGFGLVAVEAMACGKPVVVSNVPGLSDVVGPGGIKANSIDEFVNSIIKLEDEDTYKCYQSCAKEQVNKYDIMLTVHKYVEIYNELCGLDNVEGCIHNK